MKRKPSPHGFDACGSDIGDIGIEPMERKNSGANVASKSDTSSNPCGSQVMSPLRGVGCGVLKCVNHTVGRRQGYPINILVFGIYLSEQTGLPPVVSMLSDAAARKTERRHMLSPGEPEGPRR